MVFQKLPPLLCVGLYDDWLSQVTQHLAEETSGLEQYLTEASRDIRLDFNTRSAEAARAILMFVPFNLRARIDPADILDPPRMLTRLEEETRPFDLFGLPRELRDNIYECIPEFQDDRTVVFNGYFGGRQNALPAITRASRQLRNETHPMFIKRANFNFVFIAEDSPHGGGLDFVGPHNILGSWLLEVIGHAAQHLRSVQVQFEFQTWSGSSLVDSCFVTYNDTAGLSCRSSIEDSSLERLFTEVQEGRKETALRDKKGEAIAALLFYAMASIFE